MYKYANIESAEPLSTAEKKVNEVQAEVDSSTGMLNIPKPGLSH